MRNEIEQEKVAEFLVEEICAPEYVDDWCVDEYEEMGIDPMTSTESKPGSDDKVMMLSARYAAGIPLWNNSDCYDHGPGMLQGEEGEVASEDSAEEETVEVEEEVEV